MAEITDDEFQLFEAYKQFGTPDELAGAIQELGTIKQGQAISEASAVVGYKPTVLAKLAKDIQVYAKDGKAYAKDGDAEIELTEYAKTNWSEFLPSLQATTETKKEKGVAYVTQPQVNKSAKENANKGNKLATNFVMQRYGWVLKNDAAN